MARRKRKKISKHGEGWQGGLSHKTLIPTTPNKGRNYSIHRAWNQLINTAIYNFPGMVVEPGNIKLKRPSVYVFRLAKRNIAFWRQFDLRQNTATYRSNIIFCENYTFGQPLNGTHKEYALRRAAAARINKYKQLYPIDELHYVPQLPKGQQFSLPSATNRNRIPKETADAVNQIIQAQLNRGFGILVTGQGNRHKPSPGVMSSATQNAVANSWNVLNARPEKKTPRRHGHIDWVDAKGRHHQRRSLDNTALRIYLIRVGHALKDMSFPEGLDWG